MVDAARTRLARFGDRVEYVVADLLEPLPIAPVDAILSTATFHWVLDHDRLFRNLAAVLRPGGRLVAQCGGAGNIARVNAVMRDLGIARARRRTSSRRPRRPRSDSPPPGFTDDPDVAAARADPDRRRRVGALPADGLPRAATSRGSRRASSDAFVAEVIRRLDRPELDYVRLNIDATRAA